MPTEINSVLIFILAILPGIPGEKIFISFSGSDWREKVWQKAIRILMFSVLGFIIYSAFTSITNFPKPIYIFPATFSSGSIETIDIGLISIAYLSHWIASGLVGLVTGIFVSFIGKKQPTLVYPSTWDIFLRSHTASHWVVITLTNSQVLKGFIASAELSVGSTERDIILEEPAIFLTEENRYSVLPYKSIFLTSNIIFSIAIIHDPDIDKRETQFDNDFILGDENA